ncbi:MAG: hypothetical protein GX348_04830 [Veillonellaceae bacterium]|jgi:hypothetical protein|nr:hypothetical protein [Veillonellaceae bacterium]
MRYRMIVFLLLLLILAALAGCGTLPASEPVAGLRPNEEDKLTAWKVHGNLIQQGEGNTYRVLSGDKWNSGTMLELAAGGSGSLEYSVEGAAGPNALAKFHLQFLSTQGTGRLKISSVDSQGKIISTVGWVVTGQLPANSSTVKWIDIRSNTNYKGDWMQAVYNITDIFTEQFTAQHSGNVGKYRLSVEVGQGQHALIKEFAVGHDKEKSVKIMPAEPQIAANVGDKIEIRAVVHNDNKAAVHNIEVMLLEPYGFGVTTSNAVKAIEILQPNESRELIWQVSAQRANSVNLNKPWQVGFAINNVKTAAIVKIDITDLRPGKVFYVMTEDLEPIDSAGYPVDWGNKNGWLDSEEYIVQLVHKAEKLNRIAELHGAKWTHYIAWPAVKAAEWAASQSKDDNWQKAVTAIEQSVRHQSERGHEYGIHLHSDYDPYLPGNVLSYNPAVDGLWANHLKHGWAHSTADEGDFNDHTSRVGMLYSYQRILDRLASASRQGQILTARAGSFDFGNGSEDELKSTAAFRKTGLWGSSDADGNAGGVTSADYGQEIYFAAPDDINTRATDLQQLGVVEFKPTPRAFICYDNQTAAVMNSKADQGMAYFTVDGQVQPGVHAIVGFTHAMFIMGQGDWKSLQGGQFDAINDHLAYLKAAYADSGQLVFGTATELVAAYLDYYTPKLTAVYGECLKSGNWISEYAINILGRDIVIDQNHRHNVSVKYPLYYRDDAYRISILKNGEQIYSTWALPTPYNDIEFTVDDAQAKYTMRIYHNNMLFWLVDKIGFGR